MRLYYMSRKMPMMAEHKTLLPMPLEGGYVPMLLEKHHGAGIGSTMSMGGGVDLKRAKDLLSNLSISNKKKKYISI